MCRHCDEEQEMLDNQRKDEMWDDVKEIVQNVGEEIYYDFNFRVSLREFASNRPGFLEDFKDFLAFAKFGRTSW